MRSVHRPPKPVVGGGQISGAQGRRTGLIHTQNFGIKSEKPLVGSNPVPATTFVITYSPNAATASATFCPIWAVRKGAPTNLARAGAFAGLVAGGVSATAYTTSH